MFAQVSSSLLNSYSNTIYKGTINLKISWIDTKSLQSYCRHSAQNQAKTGSIHSHYFIDLKTAVRLETLPPKYTSHGTKLVSLETSVPAKTSIEICCLTLLTQMLLWHFLGCSVHSIFAHFFFFHPNIINHGSIMDVFCRSSYSECVWMLKTLILVSQDSSDLVPLWAKGRHNMKKIACVTENTASLQSLGPAHRHTAPTPPAAETHLWSWRRFKMLRELHQSR